MTDIITLSTFLSIIVVAGSGFYFLGRLSARVDDHAHRLHEHKLSMDRIYDKIDVLSTEMRHDLNEVRRAINGKD